MGRKELSKCLLYIFTRETIDGLKNDQLYHFVLYTLTASVVSTVYLAPLSLLKGIILEEQNMAKYTPSDKFTLKFTLSSHKSSRAGGAYW